MWADILGWLRVQKDDEILLKHKIQEEEEKREDFKIVLEVVLEDILKNMFM